MYATFMLQYLHSWRDSRPAAPTATHQRATARRASVPEHYTFGGTHTNKTHRPAPLGAGRCVFYCRVAVSSGRGPVLVASQFAQEDAGGAGIRTSRARGLDLPGEFAEDG